MERIDLHELGPQVVARVSRGETIEIADRGHPVARLVPVEDAASILARLVASGRALAPTGGGPLPVPPELGDRAVDVSSELTAMRNEERW